MYICFCAANPYPDVRRRYWNAYMLFYQKISDQNSPVLPKKSRVSIMRQEAEDLTLWVHPSPSRSAMDNVQRHQLFIFSRSISKPGLQSIQSTTIYIGYIPQVCSILSWCFTTVLSPPPQGQQWPPHPAYPPGAQGREEGPVCGENACQHLPGKVWRH